MLDRVTTTAFPIMPQDICLDHCGKQVKQGRKKAEQAEGYLLYSSNYDQERMLSNWIIRGIAQTQKDIVADLR